MYKKSFNHESRTTSCKYQKKKKKTAKCHIQVIQTHQRRFNNDKINCIHSTTHCLNRIYTHNILIQITKNDLKI